MVDIMRKVMLVGQSGQLGRCIIDAWREDKQDLVLIPVSKVACDVASVSQVQEAVAIIEPDFIINTAAYHDLKKCEENPGMASRVNVNGPRILSENKPKHCKLIHISTDYVFNGDTDRPYKEEDETDPVNIYGLTKLEGERFPDLVIRTSSLFSRYGSTGKRNSNFVLWLTSEGVKQPVITLDDHIKMVPTYAPHLAKAILECIHQFDSLPRILHIVSSGRVVSWHEFGRKILDVWDAEAELAIRPPESSETPPRPTYSALDGRLAKNHLGCIDYWLQGIKEMHGIAEYISILDANAQTHGGDQ
jgi:dTDP-4-dehydrorhamnose reductase